MRIEHDALGMMSIEDNNYYGIQTKRAIDNFSVSGRTIGECASFIRAVVHIKKAAAFANHSLGDINGTRCDAIRLAADEILSGGFAEQFPIDIFHGGGGTAANMNINEVLANRATELITGSKGYDPVHPNTHVNMGQSTNDVIPAAMKMAVRSELAVLKTAIEHALAAIRSKENAFSKIVTIGRTCLQDALPITVGQFLSGGRGGLERHLEKIEAMREELLELPLPGTAIGTCFGASPGFSEVLYQQLAEITGSAYRQEKNLFDGLQNADIWISVSALLKSIAALFNKISSDLRLLSSGPRAGLNELILPAVQPGSSIMPGKINPVMPEMMMQIGFKVFGNDYAVSLAADRGELELNIWEMVILQCIMESCVLLANGIRLFSDRCLSGLAANEQRCAEYASSSLALSTVIAIRDGYPFASEIAKEAAEQQCNIRDAVVGRKYMTPEEAARLFDPLAMTDNVAFEKIIARKK